MRATEPQMVLFNLFDDWLDTIHPLHGLFPVSSSSCVPCMSMLNAQEQSSSRKDTSIAEPSSTTFGPPSLMSNGCTPRFS